MSLAQLLYAKLLKKIRGSALRNCDIHPDAKVNSGSSFANVRMGKYSYSGYDCTFLNCEIGKFCSIASRVTIGGAAHPMHYLSTSSAFLSRKDSIRKKFSHHDYMPNTPVTIGNDVWIGDGAFLKSGITVGHGAIIGMGSVVTKDVAPYSIVGGNPASVLKMRFEPDVVDALLKFEWWNMPEKDLSSIGGDFKNPRNLLTKWGYL